MLSVLLVDDEELSRFAFKTLVSRHFNEIRIIAEAENGTDALMLYRQLKPDLVIMDIRMPGMSGLDALRHIFSEFPQANVLISSAYDSFSYVTQALDLGVKGYLLKPVTRDDLEEKLQKIIESDLEMENSSHTLGDQTALKMLLSGTYSNSVQEDLKNAYGGCIRQGLLACLSGPEQQLADIMQALRQAIRDVIPEKTCSLTAILGNRVVYYLANPKQDSEYSVQTSGEFNPLSWSEQITENVLQEVPSAYVLAQSVITNGNWREAWQKINESAAGHYTTPPNLSQLILKLLGKLRMSDRKGIQDLANDWLAVVLELPDEVRYIEVGKLIFLLNHELEKMGISTDYSNFYRIHKGDLTKEQADMLELAARQQISHVLDSLQTEGGRRGDLLQRINSILLEQPLSDITLNRIALDLGISSQYLCRAFKEETGKTFLEYLTARRLETAVELLRGTDCPIRDIAQLCGYQDTVYFARLFKRNTGLTPSDYRSRSDI